MRTRRKILVGLSVPVFLLSACGGAGQEASESPQTASTTYKQIDSLSEKIRSESKIAPKDDQMYGGTVRAGEQSQQWFNPVLPGPVSAKFLCEKGRVSVRFNNGEKQQVECGKIHSFTGINPYSEGMKGLSLTVESEINNAWSVALFSSKEWNDGPSGSGHL
jgi:hypothetical protein